MDGRVTVLYSGKDQIKRSARQEFRSKQQVKSGENLDEYDISSWA